MQTSQVRLRAAIWAAAPASAARCDRRAQIGSLQAAHFHLHRWLHLDARQRVLLARHWT